MSEPKLAIEQLNTLEQLYAQSIPEFDRKLRNLLTANDLLSIKRVCAVGDGDSYHAAAASRYAFMKLAPVTYSAVSAMPFLAYEAGSITDFSPNQTLVIGISASGESRRVIQSLKKVKERNPYVRTMAMVGNPESSAAKAADIVFDVSIPDFGRAPGIRSYAASLAGLLLLSIRLGEMHNVFHMHEANAMRAALSALGKNVAETVGQAQLIAGKAAKLATRPVCTFAGSGNQYGSAMFCAAKQAEIAGMTATYQDLEEWMHVESLAYPLDAPLCILAAGGNAFEHAVKVMEAAKKRGHPVLAITDYPDHEKIRELCECIFPVDTQNCPDYFSHLLFYIPSIPLGVEFALCIKRGMFMSDNTAIAAERKALSLLLKEDA